MNKITIATRASALALWQAEHIRTKIKKSFPEIEVEINKIISNGDKILDKPLALIGGKGHFTKELEDEMLLGNANLAVHSLKDVPTSMPDGLELVSITKREDQSDAFLSHNYKSIYDLPKGSVVGTTSLRRRMQLLKIRPDLSVKDLRGNINTRLEKLKNNKYDGIILAWIGLNRLDLLKEIPFVSKLSLSDMVPPMGQASLGIQIISKNDFVREVALSLNDEESYICSIVERDFIGKIEAGCSAPVACNATIRKGIITLKCMVGYPDGTNILEEEMSLNLRYSNTLGEKMAGSMIKNGAMDILKKAESMMFKDSITERI